MDKDKPVTLEELVVSTLAMVDAVTNLLIEKGIITDAEFKQGFLRNGQHISGFSIQLCSNSRDPARLV